MRPPPGRRRPSFGPEPLPAVVVPPPFRKAGLSLASESAVPSGQGCSSISKRASAGPFVRLDRYDLVSEHLVRQRGRRGALALEQGPDRDGREVVGAHAHEGPAVPPGGRAHGIHDHDVPRLLAHRPATAPRYPCRNSRQIASARASTATGPDGSYQV
jgi:hypothetical protein